MSPSSTNLQSTGNFALLPAHELAASIARGELSSRELLDVYLERVERLNPKINAVVTLDVERARHDADTADRRVAAGERLGPLHGLPITIKDCIETAGLRTTAGATELANYVPVRDATCAARVRAAGAIVFGKTNLPAWADDCQTSNELFGTTNNPWDLERTPGGSSGGPAAAVAAGLTAFDIGSDLGGSIRIPAHFCGVYGHKPSYRIVPLRGHIPPPPGVLTDIDVAVIGPLARDPDDLELVLDVISGPDVPQSTGWRLSLPPPRADRVADYRIAVWLDDPYCPIDRTMLGVLEGVVDAMRAAGVRVVDDVHPIDLASGHRIAQRIIHGGISHAIPQADYDALVEHARTSPPDDTTPHTRWARHITQSARELNMAIEERAHQAAAWAEFFEHHDVLLCPVMLTPAFPHTGGSVDERTVLVDGAPRPYADQFAWLQAVGVAHLPVTVAPVGTTPEGLPVGVQIVAPYLEDRTAIDVARHLSELLGGYVAPPGDVRT